MHWHSRRHVRHSKASVHLADITWTNAGDEEVVSQEEGGREGSAAGGEEGGVGEATRTYVGS